MPDKNKEIK